MDGPQRRFLGILASMTVAMGAITAWTAWETLTFAPLGLRIGAMVLCMAAMMVPLAVHVRMANRPDDASHACPECHSLLRDPNLPFCLGCGRAFRTRRVMA